MAAPQLASSDSAMQFLQFLMNLGGTKTGTTQTSTLDPKVQEQLMQLFSTQMGQTTPEGMQAIVQALFKQGAAAVPQLNMQFAQSAGARSSNNSALNLANQQLQTRLAEMAVMKLLDAQNNAAKTGSVLAEGTKKTSTTQTAKPGNPALMLAPFVLGQIPKLKGLLPGLGAGAGVGADIGVNSFTSDFANPVDGSGVLNNPSAFVGGLDAGAPVLDGGAGVDWDIGSSLGDAFSSSFDFGTGEAFGNMDYGMFFADGGLVKKDGERNIEEDERRQQYLKSRPKGGATDATPKQSDQTSTAAGSKNLGVRLIDYITGRSNKFADGGLVKKSLNAEAPGYANGGQVRGTNDTGPTESDSPQLATAINGAGDTSTFGPGAPGAPSNGLPDFGAETLGQDVLAYFGDLTRSNSGWDNPAQFNYAGKDGNTYTLQAAGGGAGGASGEAGYGTANETRNEIRQFRPGSEGGNWDSYAAANPYDKTFNMDGSFRNLVFNSPEGNDWMGLLSSVITAVGLATGNPALVFARGIGTRVGADALRTTLNKDRPQGSQFGGVTKELPGFSKGGPIEGPGTETSDSIPIMVSDEEYVVNAEGTKMFLPILEAINQMGLESRGAQNG